MMSILFFLVLGIIIGAKINFKERSIKLLNQGQSIGVILLLFVMGLSIGLDKDLLSKLQSLGYKALIFAALTTAFSIAAVFLATYKYKTGGKPQ